MVTKYEGSTVKMTGTIFIFAIMHMIYDRHCTVITGLWLGSGLGRLTTALGTLKC